MQKSLDIEFEKAAIFSVSKIRKALSRYLRKLYI